MHQHPSSTDADGAPLLPGAHSGVVALLRWRGPGLLSLPEPVWRTRHRWVTSVLLAHLPALAVWAFLRHTPASLGALLSVPAALYLLAAADQLTRGRVRVPRVVASCAAAAGLMACSSYLVSTSQGYIEAHFHFFVMVPVVALYEAWAPFSVAASWVLLQHGLVGTLWPDRVFGLDHRRMAHPWSFAVVHAGFFAAACAGSLTAWTLAERARGVQQGLVEELRHRTLHDDLTGLANRAHLATAMQAAPASGAPVAVLALDLDKFKEVNDTLGHSAGDELLRIVAGRIATSVSTPALTVRLGGDEFAVLLPGHDVDRALAVARRLRAAICRSCRLLDETVDVSVSVSIGVAHRSVTAAPPQPGAAHAPAQIRRESRERSSATDGGSSEEAHTGVGEQLLREADVAMYHAKRSGDGVSLYDASSDQHTHVRLTGLNDFTLALDDEDQILVHFQPQLSLTTGNLVSVEALARWNHPSRGLLSPSDFITMATSPDLEELFTRRVLDAAVAQARDWMDRGYHVPISVNIPPRCLLRSTFAVDVAACLQRHEVPAWLLCLEATEDALINDPSTAAHVLEGLRATGVRCSLDDFGTGFSSLSYLRRLPLDELKIDRSFVTGLFPHGPDEAADDVLVASMTDLGHHLGLRVVAEGVENTYQLDALRRLGCDAWQGFLHSPAVPAAALTPDLLLSASRAGVPQEQRRGGRDGQLPHELDALAHADAR